MNGILCLILSSLVLYYVKCELVELHNGLINGTVEKTAKDRLFLQFYGIPYAEAPVGVLRFKPPVAIRPWSGVKDCSKPPPICIQPADPLESKNSTGQEDCLYLNVFVPKDLFKPSGKTPVIIAIHGGGYQTGAGEYCSPDYFMDRDVIFVSINYRLGILGRIFGMNNDVISGNFGMKDQALALRWVQENIARFGGDPGNVTLLGYSAGAASIHLHMYSPLSKGLFHKAILQSGSAFAPWSHHDIGYGEATATAILVISGCFREKSAQILKCMQRIPAEEFYTLETRLRILDDGLGMVIKPIIETNVKNQPFLTQRPGKTGYLTKVPWLTGVTSGEGAFHVAAYLRNDAKLAKALNSDKKRILPLLNEYYRTTKIEDVDNVTQKIVDFYFGSKDIGFETALKFVEMMSDSYFTYSSLKAVQMHNDSRYVYLYDHRGSFSYQDFANLTIDLGVSHADDTVVIFRDKDLEAKFTPQDRNVSETVVKFWTNFAIYGDPNGLAEEKIWKPMETKDVEYLHIKSESVVMEKGLFKGRFEFWDSLPIGWK